MSLMMKKEKQKNIDICNNNQKKKTKFDAYI